MSAVGVLLPLIFVLSCLLLLFFLMKSGRGFTIRFINGRKTYILLTIYIVVLLISVGVFFIIPSPEKSISNQVVELDKVLNSNVIVDDVVYGGGSIELYDDYIENKWEFELEADDLSIIDQMNEAYMPIIIDEKDEADGMVEVTTYRTPSVVKGMDITDQIDAVGISFSPHKLQVMVAYTKLSFVTFEQEFIAKQFSSDSSDVAYDEDIYLGDDLLYIRIPKGVQIEENDDLYIEFIK